MNYQWSSCNLAGSMLPGHENREIAENIKVRPAPPVDVFCFPLVDSWRARIWDLLDDYVTDEVTEEFIRNPPEYVVSDDLGWLDDIIFKVTGETFDIKELTAERLTQEYRAFRVAHATRTNDLAQFYRMGLRCLRAEEVEDRARSIFLNGRFSTATEDRFQEAIEDMRARKTSGGREGHLYFCADERSLITRSGGSGHYLIYGSEYLYCLGIRVVSTWEAKRALKEIGLPTMLVCDIPTKLMRSRTLQEFAGSILEYLFCELAGFESSTLSPGSDFTLSLGVDLPPDHIIGHYHPQKIHDPLGGY